MLKIIDWEKKGNLIRLYLGDKNNNDYWGDDWDDAPYEHNAEQVYEEFIKGHIDVLFPFDYIVTEPAEDYHYHNNTPFSKEKFKNREAPFIVALLKDDPNVSYYTKEYSNIVGDKKAIKFYFEDEIDDSLNGKTVIYSNNKLIHSNNHTANLKII